MANSNWFKKEYVEIEKIDEALKKRKEAFKKKVFEVADKTDKGKSKKDTRFFDVSLTGKKLMRFNKIARNTFSINLESFKKVFGQKGKKFSNRKAVFSEVDFLDKEQTIPNKFKPILSKFIKTGFIPDKDKLNEGFRDGEVTEKQLKSVVDVDTSYTLRVNVVEIKEDEDEEG